jgi:hypothetical protein
MIEKFFCLQVKEVTKHIVVFCSENHAFLIKKIENCEKNATNCSMR